MDRWSELRTALHVAELGTVSAAAASLGYHRATVNRHIDALEAEIGARIFLRHAQGYTLTEVGHQVLRVAQKTKELTDDLSGRLKGASERLEGELRLSVLAPFVSMFLAPVARFKNENPHCIVEIDTSEELARLEYGEAHIAIRSGQEPRHPDYIVQALGRVRLNLYAHESYIERFGLPKSATDLDGHRFVAPHHEDRRLPFWPWLTEHVRPDQITVSSPDVWVNVEAISRGLGMGFMSDHEAGQRQGLRPVFTPQRIWFVRLWLTTHVDLHRTAKVQAMHKIIKSEFDRNARTLEGEGSS
ncbi:MAG: LysR family transcriptional regulator [Pseudomonadota bacterium]